jgi:hypothetical protein
MAAVLTKKPGGDYATQLTFPAVFAQQAAANHLTSQYYPEGRNRPMELLKGSGLQEDYHEQKRLDANRRCLNGVRDNAASMARFLSSHANYIMPKPVLGQRKYANPSNGNQTDIYSNRPIQWNQSMSGGVMRTTEGQQWAIGKLKERIPQLDAITAAKEAFLAGMPMGAMSAEQVGIADITAKVELYGLLNRVESDVEGSAIDKKTVEKSQSALRLMFSFIPFADVRELEEVMEKVEYIGGFLSGILTRNESASLETKLNETIMKYVEYLKNLYDKMREYLVRMNGVMNRPRKEREKASSVFIKSLGFAELDKKVPKVSEREQRALAAALAAAPGAEEDEEEEEEEEAEGGVPDLPVFRVGTSLDSLSSSADQPGLGSFDRLAFEEARGYVDNPDIAFPSSSASSASSSALDSLSSFRRRGPSPPRPSFRPVEDEKEPEFDEDNRDAPEFAQGVFVEDAARGKQEAAPRSNMASAEMAEEEVAQVAPVFESAPASAAVAGPQRRRPLVVRPAMTDAEREQLDRNQRELSSNPFLYKAALVRAVNDGTIESSDFDTAERLDGVAQYLKSVGLVNSAATGSALRGYVKSQYKKRVELIEATKKLQAKASRGRPAPGM